MFSLNEPINPLTVSLRTGCVHGEDPFPLRPGEDTIDVGGAERARLRELHF